MKISLQAQFRNGFLSVEGEDAAEMLKHLAVLGWTPDHGIPPLVGGALATGNATNADATTAQLTDALVVKNAAKASATVTPEKQEAARASTGKGKPAAEKPADKPAPAADAMDGKPVDVAGEVVPYAALQAAVFAFAAKDRAGVKAILDHFGAGHAKEIPEARRAEAIGYFNGEALPDTAAELA